eukprot:CAMPEP_0180657494 /NCGR_PEP_ID=MMETSP1037_2-20121125/56457_1 /TAXON_ID=632150 /ORGANISM="Azadinium spinosum, Strain 3D9" /LENGTH=111 /DNA_ID=CAMNT_0022684231 /DNA_START=79 /DNA_END=410 /DNA_ORIENTATION=+
MVLVSNIIFFEEEFLGMDHSGVELIIHELPRRDEQLGCFIVELPGKAVRREGREAFGASMAVLASKEWELCNVDEGPIGVLRDLLDRFKIFIIHPLHIEFTAIEGDAPLSR